MASPDHPFHDPELRIPRFLFRGFNGRSGGGEAGLNTTEGIIPHGFLQGYDTEPELGSNMNPQRVVTRVQIHCSQRSFPPTPFSSWSHDWRTALGFARTRYSETAKRRRRLKGSDCGHIAVLDTWALGDENTLRNRIFHIPQFGIRNMNVQCEWLIWGPVSGPAYRCVPVSTVREATGCQTWPDPGPPGRSGPCLPRGEVRDSMLVAGCFQRGDDGGADVMLGVAAAELARRMCGDLCEIAPWGNLDAALDKLLWPGDVLGAVLGVFALCRPVLSGRPLVHGRTAVVGFPGVRLMHDLLLEAEGRWRHPDSGTHWAPVDWKQIWSENFS